MNRSTVLLGSLLLVLFLLPTAAGRLLLDLAGGLMLVLIALPLVLAGVGWIGWKLLQSRMVICSACGAASFGGSSVCAVCGTPITVSPDSGQSSGPSVPASEVTIDVSAQDAGSDS